MASFTGKHVMSGYETWIVSNLHYQKHDLPLQEIVTEIKTGSWTQFRRANGFLVRHFLNIASLAHGARPSQPLCWQSLKN